MMNRTLSTAAALALVMAGSTVSAADVVLTSPGKPPMKKDYPFTPVPFTQVHLNDAFWAPRIETNRTVTIPFAFEQCEKNGRMANFEHAAAVLKGEAPAAFKASEFPFDDTDPYKVIEGASYALAVKPDPKLDAYVDKLIGQIAAAQEPDGYLYTSRTMNPTHPHAWSGQERWVLDRELSHELYNFGHLAEAAAAHYEATGKKSLLTVATKFADCIDKTFGPGKQAIWPGHQIAEMALVKLYRVTGEERYLYLAKFLLDVRGPDGKKGSGTPYNQSHEPVVQQREAVGHAVRATYMYSGMADVAAITGDESYIKAIDAIWDNVAQKKLYITGGIGATGHGEAFGANYELPNMTAYNETCAAIGNVYWNQRLFLLHGDAKYIDVLERTLYNGLISGVSLEGNRFFYPNPLESKGQHQRSPWFGCACCPSNVCRFMASIPGYVYAHRGNDVYVNLFAGGKGSVPVGDKGIVELIQETKYPWDGAVKLTVTPKNISSFALRVRVPGWARNQPVPSDLYAYEGKAVDGATLSVNGQPAKIDLKDGYAVLERSWKAGDVVELNLPMPVRRVTANDQVAADRGRVALERGPIVYCVEWPDNANGKVRNVLLKPDAPVSVDDEPDLLHGVLALKAKASAYTQDDAGKLTATDIDLTAIPYYAWAHRGRGEMSVWMAQDESAVKPTMPKTIASSAKITTSPGATNPNEIADGVTSGRPGEEQNVPLHWWPRKGKQEWVEYAFSEPERVSSASVWWFDDTGRGECRIPKTWRLLYKDTAAGSNGEWKPVKLLGDAAAYDTEKDKFNAVTFEAVTTPALRLELESQPDWSTGIEEWQVK